MLCTAEHDAGGIMGKALQRLGVADIISPPGPFRFVEDSHRGFLQQPMLSVYKECMKGRCPVHRRAQSWEEKILQHLGEADRAIQIVEECHIESRVKPLIL